MFRVKYSSFAPYSVEQMFNVINDINSYNEFIPGCNMIKILKQNDNELVAEIVLVSNSLVKSVITHNFYIKNKSIVIFLLNSPFKSFYGKWSFSPVTDSTSDVEYVSYYEFKSVLLEKMCNVIFQKIFSNIIKVFILRAYKVYGIYQ